MVFFNIQVLVHMEKVPWININSQIVQLVHSELWLYSVATLYVQCLQVKIQCKHIFCVNLKMNESKEEIKEYAIKADILNL